MSPRNSYYVLSGRIGASAPVYVLLAGGTGTVILAALYALFIRYNPFIYFSFIATLIFGLAIGFLATHAAQAGKSRSKKFNVLAALTLAAFGLWAHWLIWIMLTLDQGDNVAQQLVFAGPAEWNGFFSWLAENYHLTIGRYVASRTHGAELSTQNMCWIWIAEAAMITAAALLGTGTATDRRLYSESCGKWARTALAMEVAGMDVALSDLRSAFEAGDFSVLEQVARLDPEAYRTWKDWKSLKFELIAEPDDPALRAINVQSIDNRWDTKGRRKERAQDVVRRLLLPLAEYDALIERLRALSTTPSVLDA